MHVTINTIYYNCNIIHQILAANCVEVSSIIAVSQSILGGFTHFKVHCVANPAMYRALQRHLMTQHIGCYRVARSSYRFKGLMHQILAAQK